VVFDARSNSKIWQLAPQGLWISGGQIVKILIIQRVIAKLSGWLRKCSDTDENGINSNLGVRSWSLCFSASVLSVRS